MSLQANRRQFMQSAAAGGLGLTGLPAVSADDAKVSPQVVRLDSGIEPLVRVFEETPRDRLIEEVAGRIRKGLSYRETLAALFLAGVRNVEPRPNVGFKFHSVLVVHSAHLASQAAPDSDRWLPIFWALDNFKEAQARNISERQGWRMPAVNESAVPSARKARQAFIDALDKWDAPAADVAIAGLVRSAGASAIAELLWQYAPRDFRDIGHKAIFAANARRTLSAIGWQEHAEPILRSLVYAMMAARGGNPAQADDPADRPGRVNRQLATTIREDWLDGKVNREVTIDLLAMFRQASADEASKNVVAHLNQGLAPQSIWDAVFAASAELLMRRPGIVALHSLTTANSLRFAFEASGQDDTRRWLLLQAAAFTTLFRGELANRKEKLDEIRIDTLEPSKEAASVDAVFATLSKDKRAATRMAFAYLNVDGDPRTLMDTGRRLIFRKGNESHDFKFSAAVLEDYSHISAEWRQRFLAASMNWMRGSGDADTSLWRRIQAALNS